MKIRPVVLCILDGFGVSSESPGNAIRLAQTPVFDRLLSSYPAWTIQASGEAVGLPWGEMGNSEVGHITIGAGRVLFQDLPRITRAIADGSFFTNDAFVKAAEHVKRHGSQLHFAGIVSSGGIHGSNEHLSALLDFAAAQAIDRIVIHAFLDGRDTPYNSAQTFIEKLERQMHKANRGRIATLIGRYWAMDRDRHWDRTERAYRAIVEGKADATANGALEAIEASYKAGVYDEEFTPTVLLGPDKEPRARVADNDAIILFNFRNDRMRQLTKAFVAEPFEGFARTRLSNLFVVTMTEYEEGLPVTVAFSKEHVALPLAKVVSDAGLKQLHVAETEKYAHVTFFLNGGREEAFPNEDRILIPSPMVASFDAKPDMSARGITDATIAKIKEGRYDFIVLNFANVDMVGHTGKLPAIIRAVETVDTCLGQLVDATLTAGGAFLITADHGNAEEVMNLQTGVIDKEHSANPVPFVLVEKHWEGKGLPAGQDLARLTPSGFLADVAPTILTLMGISIPEDMTGRSLIHKDA